MKAACFLPCALALCLACGGAHAAKPASQVVLPSGVTLADWINVKNGGTPTLADGREAARLVRDYGPYRELLALLHKVSERDEIGAYGITRENAAERIALLDRTIAELGDWPALHLAGARAQALLGNAQAARRHLRMWLQVSPDDDRQRPVIVKLMVDAQGDDAPLAAWAGNAAVFPSIEGWERGLAAFPRRKVGQWWEYESDSVAGKTSNVTTVVRVDADGTFETEQKSTGFRSRAIHDRQGSPLETRHFFEKYDTMHMRFESDGSEYAFPLEAGKKWFNTGAVITLSASPPSTMKRKVTAAVTAIETLTLPKGSFRVLVIDRTTTVDSGDGSPLISKTRCWYMPDLGLCGKIAQYPNSLTKTPTSFSTLRDWGDARP
jgi:hypothetical protein